MGCFPPFPFSISSYSNPRTAHRTDCFHFLLFTPTYSTYSTYYTTQSTTCCQVIPFPVLINEKYISHFPHSNKMHSKQNINCAVKSNVQLLVPFPSNLSTWCKPPAASPRAAWATASRPRPGRAAKDSNPCGTANGSASSRPRRSGTACGCGPMSGSHRCHLRWPRGCR